MQNKENLFDEFPEISEKDWIEKVEKDLKGKAFEELFWQIDENIKVAPFYQTNDFTANIPDNKTTSNDWETGEDIPADNPATANRQLLEALVGGVDAPGIIIDHQFDQKDLALLFKNVILDYISVHFLFKGESAVLPFLENFVGFLRHSGVNPAELTGSLNFDAKTPSKDNLRFTQEKLPKFKIFTIPVEEGNPAGIAETLGNSIAQAHDHLAFLHENGIQTEMANDLLQFSVSVGRSYFPEIAKLRALKILWANVLEAYGVRNPVIPVVEARLAPGVFDEDVHTNMIRSTIQAMAAVLGGVNRLTVLPSDFYSGESTAFSRRIARNVQHLMRLESFMDRVIDPAGGSYYIETLTKKIAGQAWAVFQNTESAKSQ